MIERNQDSRNPLRVGLIGFGAIGQSVAQAIAQGGAGNTRLCAVLCVDPAKHAALRSRLFGSEPICFTADPAEFFAADHQLVIEAAGQDALRDHAARTLQSGRSLLVTSIGAFSDDAFFHGLSALAAAGKGRLLLASGALPAVDWMTSAALSGPCAASITQAKPVASWRGTPAESLTNLDQLRTPTCFFEGTAREAARRFPKSSNITAMLALVTAGLDATQVRLVADPTTDEMHTRIEFSSAAGSLNVDWQGVPSLLNPKTSADVPLNVIKALRNLSGAVAFGP